MTLFLPKNFPRSQTALNYVVGHNETHMALALDYVALLNHHESANTEAVGFPRLNNVLFQVHMGFACANRNVLNICSMHA